MGCLRCPITRCSLAEDDRSSIRSTKYNSRKKTPPNLKTPSTRSSAEGSPDRTLWPKSDSLERVPLPVRNAMASNEAAEAAAQFGAEYRPVAKSNIIPRKDRFKIGEAKTLAGAELPKGNVQQPAELPRSNVQQPVGLPKQNVQKVGALGGNGEPAAVVAGSQKKGGAKAAQPGAEERPAGPPTGNVQKGGAIGSNSKPAAIIAGSQKKGGVKAEGTQSGTGEQPAGLPKGNVQKGAAIGGNGEPAAIVAGGQRKGGIKEAKSSAEQAAELPKVTLPDHSLAGAVAEAAAQSGAEYRRKARSNILPLPDGFKKGETVILAGAVEETAVQVREVFGVAETVAQSGKEYRLPVKSNAPYIPDSSKKVVEETVTRHGAEYRPMAKSNIPPLRDRFKEEGAKTVVLAGAVAETAVQSGAGEQPAGRPKGNVQKGSAIGGNGEPGAIVAGSQKKGAAKEAQSGAEYRPVAKNNIPPLKDRFKVGEAKIVVLVDAVAETAVQSGVEEQLAGPPKGNVQKGGAIGGNGEPTAIVAGSQRKGGVKAEGTQSGAVEQPAGAGRPKGNVQRDNSELAPVVAGSQKKGGAKEAQSGAGKQPAWQPKGNVQKGGALGGNGEPPAIVSGSQRQSGAGEQPVGRPKGNVQKGGATGDNSELAAIVAGSQKKGGAKEAQSGAGEQLVGPPKGNVQKGGVIGGNGEPAAIVAGSQRKGGAKEVQSGAEQPKVALPDHSLAGAEYRLKAKSNILPLPDRFKKGEEETVILAGAVAETAAEPGAEIRPVVKSNTLPLSDTSKKGGAKTGVQSGGAVKSNALSIPDRFRKGQAETVAVVETAVELPKGSVQQPAELLKSNLQQPVQRFKSTVLEIPNPEDSDPEDWLGLKQFIDRTRQDRYG